LDQPSYVRVSDMTMSDGELERVLIRIGLDKEALKLPKKALLYKVHSHFYDALPFENLTVFNKNVVALDVSGLVDKMCGPHGRGKRGGYCFELNKLLAAVLIKLGFEVEPRGGRVLLDDGITTRNPYKNLLSHLCLLVRIPGGAATGRGDGSDLFLCDVGFGKIGFLEPVPLSTPDGERMRIGHLNHRIERKVEKRPFGYEFEVIVMWYEVDFGKGPEWRRGYSFAMVQDYDYLDCTGHNMEVCGSFESPFTQRVWCEKRTSSEHVRILGKHFMHQTFGKDGTKTIHSPPETLISSAQHLGQLFSEHFGITCGDKNFLNAVYEAGMTDDSKEKWARLYDARQCRCDLASKV